jgi:hypothetical protein
MPNGRCKLHGGKSTGPRTAEGLERSRRANWKHGYYSREAKAERSLVLSSVLSCIQISSHKWKEEKEKVRDCWIFLS